MAQVLTVMPPKAEAQVELDKLDEELRNYVDGLPDPPHFIIG